MMRLPWAPVVLPWLLACSSSTAAPASVGEDWCTKLHAQPTPALSVELAPLAARMRQETAVHVLDGGVQAMMMRAHLSEAAEHTIDAQYFIFSADNVGKIATDYVLRAAERGVHVRILVDDILADAEGLALLALDAHPNVEVKIYNPNVNTGRSVLQKLTAMATSFRNVNQRMHNKTFIVDGAVAITGGRNIADEYFDFDHEYNFRDRDLLLLGAAVRDVQQSFDTFWHHPLAVSVASLLEPNPDTDRTTLTRELHQYACDPGNFWPEVRGQIEALPRAFDTIRASGALQWATDVRFLSDVPGKNDGKAGLGGGGLTTSALGQLVDGARSQLLIQSPYLVTTVQMRTMLERAVRRGVQVKILTNSLASTDNPEAFSGYQRDRDALLATGVEVYEWRPDAQVRKRLMKSALTERAVHPPVFAVHAKTMLIDGSTLVVGTFNFDPRSANLNTECITIVPSTFLTEQVRAHLLEEMRPENAWRVRPENNPDGHATMTQRIGVWFRRVVPSSIL